MANQDDAWGRSTPHGRGPLPEPAQKTSQPNRHQVVMDDKLWELVLSEATRSGIGSASGVVRVAVLEYFRGRGIEVPER